MDPWKLTEMYYCGEANTLHDIPKAWFTRPTRIFSVCRKFVRLHVGVLFTPKPPPPLPQPYENMDD